MQLLDLHQVKLWFAMVQPENFRLIKGKNEMSGFSWILLGGSEPHLLYRFCKTCGVRTFGEGNGRTYYAVSVAVLDGIEPNTDQLFTTLKFNDGRHDNLKHAPADTCLL